MIYLRVILQLPFYGFNNAEIETIPLNNEMGVGVILESADSRSVRRVCW